MALLHDVLRRCVYDCAAARVSRMQREEKLKGDQPLLPEAPGRGLGDTEGIVGYGESGLCRGVARVCPSIAGVAIKYNFRGVGLIPRIPRKYFIYYLHFVDT